MITPSRGICYSRCVDVLMMEPPDADAVVTLFGKYWSHADLKSLDAEDDGWEELDGMLRATRVLLLSEGILPASRRNSG